MIDITKLRGLAPLHGHYMLVHVTCLPSSLHHYFVPHVISSWLTYTGSSPLGEKDIPRAQDDVISRMF